MSIVRSSGFTNIVSSSTVTCSPQYPRSIIVPGKDKSSILGWTTHLHFLFSSSRTYLNASQMVPVAAQNLLPTPIPTSYLEALEQYQQRSQQLIQNGSHQPFVWPYRAFGPYLMILYLLLPPTKSKVVFFLRYPLFVLISYLSVRATLECRSSWVTYNYLIGLLNTWTILWSATHLIFRDAREDSRRIEGRVVRYQEIQKGDGPISAPAEGAIASGTDRQKLDHRRQNGKVSDTESFSKPRMEGNTVWMPTAEAPDKYVWQGLPEELLHRIDWVLDLGSSFRGPRWSHQISSLPPPPPHIQASLKDNSLSASSADSLHTRKNLLRRYLPEFLWCLFVQDVLKTIAMQDPYFWSLLASHPSPFPWPRVSRTLLSVCWAYHALNPILLLAPLGFGVLLGPDIIGEHAWPWLYPPSFGNLSMISKNGLAGAWGQWWHQLFRFAFEQTGEFILRLTRWDRKTQKGMMLKVTVAFVCSALLHTLASYTAVSDTKPWRAFVFFSIQPLGIFGQTMFTKWMKDNGWRDRVPLLLRKSTNVLVVVIWFYLTGPLVADDFASCGIWLFEPLPISPIRGLRGEKWWRWSGKWFYWHSADTWWKSGIAF